MQLGVDRFRPNRCIAIPVLGTGRGAAARPEGAMEPYAGFAERYIRLVSGNLKRYRLLEVDEGLTTVAGAESPPDAIFDRTADITDVPIGDRHMHATAVLAAGRDHVVATGFPTGDMAVSLIRQHHMHIGIACEG